MSTSETVTYLPQLQEAIWHEQAIIIKYQRNDEEVVERLIAPLGLVAKGRIWYLIAAVDEDTRTYRVSRILAVNNTGETIQRPIDFDLAAYWEQSTQDFVARLPRYLVTLEVQQPALRFITEWRFAHIQSIREKDGNLLEVIVDLEEIESAAACILACGSAARVISPDELRDYVHKKVLAFLETLND